MTWYGCVSLSDRVPAIAKGALLGLYIFMLFVSLSAEANAGPNEDIFAAATTGDRAGVEAAFAAGASVNAVDPLGLPGQTTPLSIAAAKGHRNVAEFLLDHGANVNGADGLKQTPLHIAADHGSDDVAKLLLDRGADIDARDFLETTPLQYAALQGHKTVVALLVTRGATVNAKFAFGETALHMAATAGHKEIVALLLAHGADPNIKNSRGQTPLQEMQTSALDPANKASIASVLRSTAKVSAKGVLPDHRKAPPSPPGPPMQIGSQSSDVQNGPALPNCWDVAGIARLVMQANPGAPPQVIAAAVDQFQITMGCRQAPQKTACSWLGDTWTCTTK